MDITKFVVEVREELVNGPKWTNSEQSSTKNFIDIHNF